MSGEERGGGSKAALDGGERCQAWEGEGAGSFAVKGKSVTSFP